MTSVLPEVPDHLGPQAEAARAWFAREKASEFKITGFVDGDDDGRLSAESQDFELILCGELAGEAVCLKERFVVTRAASGYEVSHAADPDPAVGSPAPALDPPVGTRLGWLDDAVLDREFVVLLFYRGLW